MTNKKSLLNKLWKGAKQTAKVAGALTVGYLALNDTAYAQNYTLTETGGITSDNSSQKDMMNAEDVPTYVLLDENSKADSKIEKLVFLPMMSTIKYGNNLIPGLQYTAKKAQDKNGQDIDVFAYAKDNDSYRKIDELFKAKGTGGGVLTMDQTKIDAAGFHTITTADGTKFVYFPVDSANNNLPEEKKKEVSEGKILGIVFPADGMIITQSVDPKTRELKYMLGNPNNIYYIEYDASKVSDAETHKESEALLDSLGKKYIASEKAKEIFQNGKLLDAEANEFKNYAFFDNKGSQDKEKKKSNVKGRLEIGGFYTIPSGFEGFINPQLKISDGSYLGLKGFYSTMTKGVNSESHEDGFTQLVNAPLNMYFVNTGADINTSVVTKNNLGAALTYNYDAGKWEANLEAGAVKRSSEQTMTSTGSEYITINGDIDSSSVENYNETNVSNSTEISPYFQVGGQWYPFNDGALKNLSIAGDVGYIFGSNSTAFGKFGLKYTFGKEDKSASTQGENQY